MRKLCARPDPSKDLKANLLVWAEQWQALREKNADAEFSWYQKQKKGAERSARLWLLDELLPWTNNHCAFCDGMGGTTNWPVEHFKPKAKHRFPEAAYDWTNLYPCCERCQGKGDEWEADLLRPDEDGYEFGDCFYFDYTAPEGVALLAKPGNQRAATLLRLYRLDDTQRRGARRREWHFWDPPPYDDPQLRPHASEEEKTHWQQARQMRQLCVERYRSGHLSLEDRPYRDLAEEVIQRLAAEHA